MCHQSITFQHPAYDNIRILVRRTVSSRRFRGVGWARLCVCDCVCARRRRPGLALDLFRSPRCFLSGAHPAVRGGTHAGDSRSCTRALPHGADESLEDSSSAEPGTDPQCRFPHRQARVQVGAGGGGLGRHVRGSDEDLHRGCVNRQTRERPRVDSPSPPSNVSSLLAAMQFNTQLCVRRTESGGGVHASLAQNSRRTRRPSR